MATDIGSVLGTIIPRTLEGITREYPNGVVIGVEGPGEWREPAARHPIFYGCYDWHSAVHSHWQLLRILRCYPDRPEATTISSALDSQFTTDGVAGEIATLRGWPGFEVPYGMAWVLQLGAELAEWDEPRADRWLEVLQPIIDNAAKGFERYMDARALPLRSGTHNQTAFSLGLVHDWARTVGRQDLLSKVESTARRYFGSDTDAPLAYEPSSVDFLSPSLAEADLMRRVLEPDEFVPWVESFLPGSDLAGVLSPQRIADPSDGQLAHHAGLNMSRAWMAEGIASALPQDHRLHEEMTRLADRHRDEGLEAALHPDYMVSHWAPTFVVYLLTRRGLVA